MKRAVIISALPLSGKINVSCGDLVIACDRGYENAVRQNITPDVIIGDFDSLGYVPEAENVIKLPVAKNDTDTGYAINYAAEKACKEIDVYGAIGGLADHTLASVQLAAGAAKRGITIRFFGDGCVMTAVTNGNITLEESNCRFSVFAIDPCTGVTIKGADFPLDNAALSPFMPLGISNRQKGKTEISVKSGTLIIIKFDR